MCNQVSDVSPTSLSTTPGCQLKKLLQNQGLSIPNIDINWILYLLISSCYSSLPEKDFESIQLSKLNIPKYSPVTISHFTLRAWVKLLLLSTWLLSLDSQIDKHDTNMYFILLIRKFHQLNDLSPIVIMADELRCMEGILVDLICLWGTTIW